MPRPMSRAMLRSLLRSVPAVAVVAGLAGWAPRLAAQQVWRVDRRAPSGGDGLSWPTAFRFLQDALAVARSGDEVRVSDGLQFPDEGSGQIDDDRASTFTLAGGVTLLGGFRGLGHGGSGDDRDPRLFITTLSGDLPRTWRNADDDAYHVVSLAGPTAATLDGLSIEHGTADHARGGGIVTHGFDLVLSNAEIVACRADDGGGGLDAVGGRVALDSVTLRRCTARGDGGGARLDQVDATLTRVTFDNCGADVGATIRGGGIFVSGGQLACDQTSFLNGFADEGGGACLDGTPATVARTTFFGDAAASDGGGLALIGSDATLDQASFYLNRASGSGGGIHARGASHLQIRRSYFEGNLGGRFAGGSGGALDARDVPSCVVEDTACKGNLADFGGALALGVARLLRVTCFFNTATVHGGAVDFLVPPGGRVDVVDCSIFSNDSDVGSALRFDGDATAQLALRGCTLADNQAQNGAALVGIPATAGAMTVRSAILYGNRNGRKHHQNAQLDAPNGALVIDWCDVEGWNGTLGGTGNFDLDPKFVDATRSDYHLLPDSPCIEAGDPDFVAPAGERMDLDHSCRVIDADLDRVGRVDLGCFEFDHVGLQVSGSLYPDSIASIFTTGTPGMPVLLLVGIRRAELPIAPFGTLFIDPGAICQCFPWAPAPSRVDTRIPADAPSGLELDLQLFATSGDAGNLSNPFQLVIR